MSAGTITKQRLSKILLLHPLIDNKCQGTVIFCIVTASEKTNHSVQMHF